MAAKQSKTAQVAAQAREDGLFNALTGMGIRGMDKRMHTGIVQDYTLTPNDCISIYRSGGLGWRIPNLLAGDMTRSWVEIEGDSDGEILRDLDRLKAKASFAELYCWGLVFGGGVMVLGLNDFRMSDMPFNEKTLRSLDWLRVYDRRQVIINDTDRYQDPNDPKYGQPQWYTIVPVTGGVSYRVHDSRVIRMDGLRLPGRERLSNQGWGDSLYQVVWNALRAKDETFAATELIVQAWELSAVTMRGLRLMAAHKGKNGEADGEEKIREWLRLMDLSRHVNRTVLLDAGNGSNEPAETLEKKSSSASGLADLLDRFKYEVNAVTGVPLRRIEGKTVGGLGDSGEGEDRIYYDKISADQENYFLDPIQRLVYLIQICKDGPFRGREIEEWSVIFKSLWQQSEKEKADTRKVDADRAAVLVSAGIVMAEEIRASFYGGEKYSGEIELDDTVYNAEKQAQAEREMELLKGIAANQPPDKQTGE